VAGKLYVMGDPWKGLSGLCRQDHFSGEPLMSTRPPQSVPKPLSLARRQLEQWRRRQPGRRRLPSELWANAVTLARACGLNRTARTLGLKYDSLKKHLEAASSEVSDPQKARPEFLELLPRELMPASLQCTITLDNGHGAPIQMHVKGIGVCDLVALTQMLRDDRA